MSGEAGALAITERGGAVRFAVRVQPRASRAGTTGIHGGALKVRVHAPPVDGAANAAVIEVIAAALGVPRRSVRLVSGERARTKIVEVAGVDVPEVRRRLGA
ncbi:MAG TPA: DUF167 family protein [Gemmatimonadaceae bacterium]|nr:DUF167 family protein [Gemmatimonadaceae bacterium]